MKKKWSPEKVKRIEKWLRERWPASFTVGPDLKPLSTDIYKEILNYRSENGELSGRVLREVLKRHTTSFGYLYGMLKNDRRYNLSGEAVEPISGEHRAWALKTLRLLQKISQKTRKAKASGNRLNAPTGNFNSSQGQPAFRRVKKSVDATAPVIRYKQSRRKLIKPVSQASAREVAVG